jgi:hypothetical protein
MAAIGYLLIVLAVGAWIVRATREQMRLDRAAQKSWERYMAADKRYTEVVCALLRESAKSR